MKKQLLIILLLILQSFVLLLPPVGSDWIIDGDTVYIDSEDAYLSATPHTIIQDTWVTFKIRSKEYEGDIDACWLFNTTNCKPTKPVYYKVGDGDWQTLTKEFTVQNIDFENMTKAYLLKNINIQKDVNYSLKCFVDIKFNTSGKYWWGVKPSALGWNKGYYIDPWWNSSWLYYRTLTINPTYIDTDLTNFPVLVNISAATSGKCDSGNSIRFLNTDNTTEYYYEIEDTWNAASYNFVWVNITSVSSSADTEFLMYYGNAGASDNQSPTNVWDSGYKLVSHLNTSDSTTVIVDSTSNHNNGTKLANAEPAQATGNIGYGQNYDGDDDNISYGNIGDTFWGFEIWIKPVAEINWDSTYVDFLNVGGTYLICGRFGACTGVFDNETVTLMKDTGGDTRTAIAENITASWHLLSVSWDDNQFQIYLDGVNLTEMTALGGTPQQTMTNLILGNYTYTVQDMDVDEFRVSIVKRNDSWMKATFHSGNQSLLTFGLEMVNTTVVTNATTGIELTNATARGYIDDVGFSGNYNYGFYIGTTEGVGESNADQNVTGAGTIAAGNNFSYNVSSLSEGTHYYDRAWVSNATFFDTGNEVEFYTKCDAPTGITATLSGCNAELAWTKGTGADKTTIVRKAGSSPANPTDGTVIYNNTGSSYSDTTAGGSHQYYGAWSWAGDKHSDGNASANLTVPSCPPYSFDTTLLTNQSLRIDWTKGLGADNTAIRYSNIVFPSTPTSGTELYNGTGTQTFDSVGETKYYRAWSYNTTTEEFSSSVDIYYGMLIINCYDEETNNSLFFDVFIFNQDGTQTYKSRNNSNPHALDVDDLPLGEKIGIQVDPAQNYSEKSEIFTYPITENSTITYVILLQVPESKSTTNVTCTNVTGGTSTYPAFTLADDVITILADAADEFDKITVTYIHDEYESRMYYRDLEANHIYTLDAYLPNADDKKLYKLIILNQFDSPIEDAYLQIKRPIDGIYVVISSLYTDASGQIDVYLIPEKHYKVIISKSGYETKTSDFIPNPDYYGSYYPITFKMTAEDTNITTVTFGDLITFTGEWITANDTLRIYFYDKDDNTTDVTFRVYESYGIYLNLTNTSAFGSITTATLYFSGLNTSRMHQVRLEMNHTKLGHILNQTIYISPIRDDERISQTWLDSIIAIVMGDFDYGYVAFALIYCPCIFLIISLGAVKQPGFGVLCAGLYIILVTWRIDLSNTFMIALSSLLILFGVIMIIVKHGKKLTGKETTS